MMREGENYFNSEDEPENEVDRKFSKGGIHHKYIEKQTKQNNFYEMEDQLEQDYEARKAVKDKNYVHEKQVDKKRRLKKQELKQGGNTRAPEVKELELQDNETSLLKKRLMKRDERVEIEDLEKSRWFDKDIFKVMGLQKKLKIGQKKQAEEGDASDDEDQYLPKDNADDGFGEVEADDENSGPEAGEDDEYAFDDGLDAEAGFMEDMEESFAKMGKN